MSTTDSKTSSYDDDFNDKVNQSNNILLDPPHDVLCEKISLYELYMNVNVDPFPLKNGMFRCYYNSIIQSLLNCKRLSLFLLKNKDNYQSHKEFINLYTNLQTYYNLNDNNKFNEFYEKLWNTFIIIYNNDIKIDIKGKEQDADEILGYILNIFSEVDAVKKIFSYTTRNVTSCNMCNYIYIASQVVGNKLDIKYEKVKQFPLITHNSNELYKLIICEIDTCMSETNCSNCCTTGFKIKMSQICELPPLLILTLPKYESYGGYTSFNYPFDLKFPMADRKRVANYKLISQIDRSGQTDANGHYMAYTYKKNDWWLCDDEIIKKETPKPIKNSYILFYHFVEITNNYDAFINDYNTKKREFINNDIWKSIKPNSPNKDLNQLRKENACLKNKITILAQLSGEDHIKIIDDCAK